MPTNRKIPDDLPSEVFVEPELIYRFSNFSLYVDLQDCTERRTSPTQLLLEKIDSRAKYKPPSEINPFELFLEEPERWFEEEQLQVMSLYLPLVNIHLKSWW